VAAAAAVWHVVVEHLVGLDEVPLHGRHLGHDFLPMELGRVRLPLALGLVLVHLEKVKVSRGGGEGIKGTPSFHTDRLACHSGSYDVLSLTRAAGMSDDTGHTSFCIFIHVGACVCVAVPV